MLLKNKTALVTGSSRGIGRAIALKLGENGARVIINGGSDEESLRETANMLAQKNILFDAFFTDVSDYEAVGRMFREIEYKYGAPDILVNNAGVSYTGLFSEMTREDMARVLNVNLMSAFYCTQRGINLMRKSSDGLCNATAFPSIINISSVWGEAGASCEAVYAATKAGMNAFTKSIAKECTYVRVNAVACGVIDTRMNEWLSAEEKDELLNRIPAGRFGTCDDVAEVVLFLASEKAAYITGQVITVDGGFAL